MVLTQQYFQEAMRLSVNKENFESIYTQSSTHKELTRLSVKEGSFKGMYRAIVPKR